MTAPSRAHAGSKQGISGHLCPLSATLQTTETEATQRSRCYSTTEPVKAARRSATSVFFTWQLQGTTIASVHQQIPSISCSSAQLRIPKAVAAHN